jgi:uncharacterized tellurite resistance protein B-like protein
MTFNKLEFIAMLKIGRAMVTADGKIEKNELSMMTAVLMSFGVTPSELNELLELSDAMDATTALGIISGMTDSQKKYVCAYLANIMIADGDVDATEEALWNLTTALCDLPIMTVGEAVKYMKKEFGL